MLSLSRCKPSADQCPNTIGVPALSRLGAHNLDAWCKAFCTDKPLVKSGQDLRALKAQNEQLKRELSRKEKALAEAAALLILQKKYRALWGEEVE